MGRPVVRRDETSRCWPDDAPATKAGHRGRSGTSPWERGPVSGNVGKISGGPKTPVAIRCGGGTTRGGQDAADTGHAAEQTGGRPHMTSRQIAHSRSHDEVQDVLLAGRSSLDRTDDRYAPGPSPSGSGPVRRPMVPRGAPRPRRTRVGSRRRRSADGAARAVRRSGGTEAGCRAGVGSPVSWQAPTGRVGPPAGRAVRRSSCGCRCPGRGAGCPGGPGRSGPGSRTAAGHGCRTPGPARGWSPWGR